jgi:heme exporter protein A
MARRVKLILDAVTIARGARTLLADLSVTVEGGEALVLTGANGTGKTTLLRAIAGLFTPQAGSIRLDGGDAERECAEHCHYVGHLNGIKPTLTAAENLAFWGRYLGSDATDSVATALRGFNLEALADIPAGYLSAGQKRRLGLARLLVAPRPLWLLDEPTVSLDAASADLVSAAVNAHVASGGIAVAATHLPLGLSAARELRLTAPNRSDHLDADEAQP